MSTLVTDEADTSDTTSPRATPGTPLEGASSTRADTCSAVSLDFSEGNEGCHKEGLPQKAAPSPTPSVASGVAREKRKAFMLRQLTAEEGPTTSFDSSYQNSPCSSTPLPSSTFYPFGIDKETKDSSVTKTMTEGASMAMDAPLDKGCHKEGLQQKAAPDTADGTMEAATLKAEAVSIDSGRGETAAAEAAPPAKPPRSFASLGSGSMVLDGDDISFPSTFPSRSSSSTPPPINQTPPSTPQPDLEQRGKANFITGKCASFVFRKWFYFVRCKWFYFVPILTKS